MMSLKLVVPSDFLSWISAHSFKSRMEELFWTLPLFLIFISLYFLSILSPKYFATLFISYFSAIVLMQVFIIFSWTVIFSFISFQFVLDISKFNYITSSFRMVQWKNKWNKNFKNGSMTLFADGMKSKFLNTDLESAL